MSIFAIIILVILGIFYFWYASIISKKNKALEALSGIDVQLKNRSELIPNILIIAKKFMEHEQQIFSEISRLREQVAKGCNKNNPHEIKSYLESSEQLSQKMMGFMARAESYPELKSSQNMLHAQQSYNEIEAQIAAARRFYNSAVGSLRNSIQIFPGNVIASIIGVNDMPMYEAELAAKQSVDASKFF